MTAQEIMSKAQLKCALAHADPIRDLAHVQEEFVRDVKTKPRCRSRQTSRARVVVRILESRNPRSIIAESVHHVATSL